MPWVTRGLREGIVTSAYPRRPDGYGQNWRGAVSVADQARFEDSLAALCPTGAIQAGTGGGVALDRGRCILCGRCVAGRPDVFAYDPSPELAALTRRGLLVSPGEEDDKALEELRTGLARRVRALKRSVHIRHVDAGSDGAEEWEVAALTNPVYDIQRLGIFFTASPRHADVLLVTGAGAAGMVEPLARTVEATPDPKVVVAAGTDAVSGGLVGRGYATAGGIAELVAVDVWIPGSPPSPFSILHGILAGIGLLGTRRTR